MKKRLICMALAAMLLTACAPAAPARPADDDVVTIVCTTYPIYLLASSLTDHDGGIKVERLDTGSTSCLHDYNLTVNDMKKLDRADVIAINGVGLEEFMEDALASSDAVIVDCSEGVELLENRTHHHEEGEGVDDHGHDDHDHGHYDPHYWMDIRNVQIMVENLRAALTELLPVNGEALAQAASGADALLRYTDLALRGDMFRASEREISGLITFHDGFQYFAHAYDLPLLESIEEEAGSEASAKEIVEITALIKEHDIPVIFTEVNGSDATAKAVSRETGCAVAQLSMCMDGPDDELKNYIHAMMNNMAAVVNGFAGEEVVLLK